MPKYNEREHKINKPRKVYVEKNKHHSEINGWLYPDRGNVHYDNKVRPWVIQDQRVEMEERYFEQLMKKQYITAFEKEGIYNYLSRKAQLTRPPFVPTFQTTSSILQPNPYHEYHQAAKIAAYLGTSNNPKLCQNQNQ